MNSVSQRLMRTWVGLGTRFLPFADAATPELPLAKLLRLSLFQVSVGMSLVLLIGTLNRVMIVELDVPASLVGIMISLPLVFAPFRAVIGFRSDTHRSELGWKRVPFIYKGTMLQFGGLAIMPFALLVLSGGGNAAQAPAWVGQLGAGLAFLLVGIGLHTTQTVGLALATDLAPEDSQPKVVGLMYVMLLFGTIASALLFGALLANFSPARLVQVIQGCAVTTIVLNAIALWKMEARGRSSIRPAKQPQSTFQQSWASYVSGGQAIRRLVAVGLGTMAFSMEDVLLEPYGGQILHLTVGDTTKLTATLAVGGLFGFGLASRVLSRGFDPVRMAGYGASIGIPAFLAVIFAAPVASAVMFAAGTFLIGFGAGLFGHGTLTATMKFAPQHQTGLALGAWGAVQASAAGVAIALGGIIRDIVAATAPHNALGAAAGYDCVYACEVILLLATLATMAPLVLRRAAYATKNIARCEDGPSALSEPTGDTMSQTINRLYATLEQAAKALAALKDEDYSDLHIVSGASFTGASIDSIVAAIIKGNVLKSDARILAKGISAGGSLVTVHPPFGSAYKATQILKQFDPIDSGLTEPEDNSIMAWDESTPMSCILQLPVLLDDATPFSKFWNVPPLGGSAAPLSSLFGIGLISRAAAPLSALIGLPLLSKDAAPLSSLLNLPTLSGETRAPR